MNDRQLGQRFAAELSICSQSTPAIKIAILQDLVGSDTSILGPLREMVSLSRFQSLETSAQESGSIQSHKNAILQSFKETYTSQVLDRMQEFLDGFTEDLKAETSIDTASFDTNPSRSQPFTDHPMFAYSPTTPTPETVVLNGDYCRNEPIVNSLEENNIQDAKDTKTAPRSGPIKKEIWMLIIGVFVAALSFIGMLRGNLLCAGLSFCSASLLQENAIALEKAQQAASKLTKARNIADYQRHLNELERQLDKITIDAGLTHQQRNQRQQLKSQTTEGRIRLKKEANHRLTVQQVSRESKTISQLSLQDALQRRLLLRRRLELVPSQSFVSPEAQALRQTLELPPPSQPPMTQPRNPRPEPVRPTWQARKPRPSWQRHDPAPERRSLPAPPPFDPGTPLNVENSPIREERLW